jgi:CubicO group peptidase (beta-lactamase class C family)
MKESGPINGSSESAARDAAELRAETDPERVGLSSARLARIDRHFARYVDDGLLAGWLALVSRRGQVAHLSTYGSRDLASRAPVEADTLWRLYSMTKPVTSVAAMILYEEGAISLNDPIARWLPAFAAPRVYAAGPPAGPTTRPANEPIRVWHLLTHTAGLTYGFYYAHPVDAMYRAAGLESASRQGDDLAATVDAIAALPLMFDPGTRWAYSRATDVLGRLIEVVSGVPLENFMTERIFAPLGMTDARFWVDGTRAGRLATLYGADPVTRKPVEIKGDGDALRPPDMISGGAGMISSAHDYHRFTQMLLGGGTVDGARLLSPRTVAFMTVNHLPGGADIETFRHYLCTDAAYAGVGFGLGFSVAIDPVADKVIGSPGEYAWEGVASTAFWVDPAEDLTAIFLTQLVPSGAHPIRQELKTLVYQAIVE